ncbi:MAG: TAXI family TRAP transporter solute-binding subunit [Alphaproteobacteria bacterium]|nr:TAXI family TRAP transporter solute-binding subunit [Alphaproteobacteria bacterium]
MKALRFLAILAATLGIAGSSAFAQEKFATIGTGAITGVYYPAGGAICRLLNQKRKEHGIRCFVESTGGSIYNLNALRDGELTFAIVQSDWQYNAYKGEGIFDNGPAFSDLRSVFSLHSEMFTVAVRPGSGIRSFSDLKGKKVNVGNPGSGMREIMQEMMSIKGWTESDFAMASELRPSDAAKALCDGTIDAMVFAAGHPNGLIQEITAGCGATLVPIQGPEVDALIKKYPYYARTAIPGGMYKGNAQNTPTFGVKATLVTTAEVSDETVYQIAKGVFNNFDDFKTLHFVFATLEKDRMVEAGLTAPLHDGALRYYKESGMLK